jgi:hypothetical protein
MDSTAFDNMYRHFGVLFLSRFAYFLALQHEVKYRYYPAFYHQFDTDPGYLETRNRSASIVVHDTAAGLVNRGRCRRKRSECLQGHTTSHPSCKHAMVRHIICSDYPHLTCNPYGYRTELFLVLRTILTPRKVSRVGWPTTC